MIKKRQKVSAEFSMSSLTDIIFLLLIFFMLTSSLVAPNSLNLKLPGSRTNVPASSETLDDVTIGNSGAFYWNGKRIGQTQLESRLRALVRRRPGVSITISPETNAPVEGVAAVMDMAMRLNINGVLAAEK